MRYVGWVFLAFTLSACTGGSVVGGTLDAGTDLGTAPDLPTLDTPVDTGNEPDIPPFMLTDVPRDRGPDVDTGPARCSADNDCMGDPRGATCDTLTGRCEACTPRADRCPAGQYCTAQNVCAAGCRDDNACMSATDGGVTRPRCTPDTRQCVQCTGDSDCAVGTRCMGNVCVPGCNTNANCASGLRCCNNACVDTDANIAACGSCGMACSFPNGTARCASGVCAIDACTAPFGNCDGRSDNGCETDTRASIAHCGACGRPCPSRAGADASCVNAVCTYRCAGGFEDCDGNTANGCETNLQTSAAHCGRCNNVCPSGDAGVGACVAGQCAFACPVGRGDCDGNATNGCETSTAFDNNHCGRCGSVCPSGQHCSAGQCVSGLVSSFAVNHHRVAGMEYSVCAINAIGVVYCFDTAWRVMTNVPVSQRVFCSYGYCSALGLNGEYWAWGETGCNTGYMAPRRIESGVESVAVGVHNDALVLNTNMARYLCRCSTCEGQSISFDPRARILSPNEYQSCQVAQDGRVGCSWVTPTGLPTDLRTLVVSYQDNAACGERTNGTIVCWNAFTTWNVTGVTASARLQAGSNPAYNNNTFALVDEGRVYSFRIQSGATLTREFPSVDDAVEVQGSAAGSQLCVRRRTGALRCQFYMSGTVDIPLL